MQLLAACLVLSVRVDEVEHDGLHRLDGEEETLGALLHIAFRVNRVQRAPDCGSKQTPLKCRGQPISLGWYSCRQNGNAVVK